MIDNVMNSQKLPDWFTDLLILRATDGLDVEQQRQFDQFVNEHPQRNQIELEAEKFELTVAAIDLGVENVNSDSSQNRMHSTDVENAMPEGLREKVLEGAKRHFKPEPATETAVPIASSRPNNGLTSREALAWLAAAAAVMLLLTGWNPFGMPTAKTATEDTPVVEPSVEEQYSDFVTGELADLVRTSWTATDEKSIASGEVVWRDSSQSGFMVFENFKPNNPAQSQYQLWIFDANTGDVNPIDGGVFDVAANAVQTIVPIDARIPVTGATMFAITEERPGGVVVSDRKRLPLLAKVSP